MHHMTSTTPGSKEPTSAPLVPIKLPVCNVVLSASLSAFLLALVFLRGVYKPGNLPLCSIHITGKAVS